MYLVIGSYRDYEVFDEHIFGYSVSQAACEKAVENLKEKQVELRKYLEAVTAISCNLNKIPTQQKYEKLKDYQERIQPIMDENEKLRDEYREKRQVLSNSIEDFDKYNELTFFILYDFEIKEVEEITA